MAAAGSLEQPCCTRRQLRRHDIDCCSPAGQLTGLTWWYSGRVSCCCGTHGRLAMQAMAPWQQAM